MALTATQVGAIGENLLINGMMKASDGRLSPFQPMADDDGLDVLFFDKITGGSAAIQLKCRRVALKKPNSEDRGNTVHFEVRKATFYEMRRAFLVAALLDEDLTQIRVSWLISMSELTGLARQSETKWVIRPSKSSLSNDRFVAFRHETMSSLAMAVIDRCVVPA